MKDTVMIMAIKEALAEEMEKDEKVFIIGEDVQQGTFGATAGLIKQFGKERVMDTPLAETAVAGAAIGSAMAGFRPVADMMFADFIWIAGNEIFLNAAKWHFIHAGRVNVPVVFMAAMGGGFKLGAEHSQAPASTPMHTPGIKVVVPSTPYDAKGLLTAAMRDNNPILFIEHKVLYGMEGPVPEEEYLVPLGKAEVKKEGSDITLISYSLMLQKTLAAAEELAGAGINAEVVDLRTLSPLDHDTLAQSVQKTHKAVVIQEAYESAGVASLVIKSLMESSFDYLDAPIKTVAAPDTVIPFSPPLEDAMLPDEAKIVQAAKEVAQ